MARRLWIGALTAAAALSVGAAGCGGGGGGEQLTAEEFVAELSAICDDINAKQDEIGQPQSVEDVVGNGQQTLDAFDDAIAEVEALEAERRACAGDGRDRLRGGGAYEARDWR